METRQTAATAYISRKTPPKETTFHILRKSPSVLAAERGRAPGIPWGGSFSECGTSLRTFRCPVLNCFYKLARKKLESIASFCPGCIWNGTEFFLAGFHSLLGAALNELQMFTLPVLESGGSVPGRGCDSTSAAGRVGGGAQSESGKGVTPHRTR